MKTILLAYATTDGHTERICTRLSQVIEQLGHRVSVVPLAQAEALDLAAFDTIVIGASIRYGKHQKQVFQFIERYQVLLEKKNNGFFSVNIVARKPEKNRPDTNPYLIKFLRQTTWRPKLLEVFAGKLDYPRYRFIDRQIIRFIMFMTHGPTDPSTIIDYTNWQQVESFGNKIANMKTMFDAMY
jgi:menaquinone-dependent protoporphyrinogen oxidase